MLTANICGRVSFSLISAIRVLLLRLLVSLNAGLIKYDAFLCKTPCSYFQPYERLTANITMAVIKDGTNAAVDGVPRLSIAITFWIDGEPGAVMDHVQHPAEIAAGINLLSQVAFFEKVQGDWVDNEEYNETADTTESKDTCDTHDNWCNKLAVAETCNRSGDGFCCASVLINSTKQGTDERMSENT